MYYLPVAFGVWLHVFFWGCGLARLTMPGRWQRYWLVLAWPAGFTLQSFVVWLGAYANLRGTNAYAWWAELMPLVLLGAALRFRRAQSWRGLWRFRGLIWLMAVNLVALILPLALATRGLTTLSLGSCDAADYAAGARVFQEFAHADRTGFIGLTEVVRVASADNFFDFWLRLNHFTPSALIALNGSIFDCSPAELTSILTAVLLIGSLPVVFWVARAGLHYRSVVALWITAIYGFGPITWYAVFHVAMGQLLAAPAIGLLTLAGIALWRQPAGDGCRWQFFGLLVVTYSLILGSYNFILVVGLVPAVAYAGGLALWQRRWRALGAWLIAMTLPLVVAGGLFWERVAGLAERFLLFQTYDFGWKIPLLTPEGLLGLIRDHELRSFDSGVRAILIVVVVFASVAAWIGAARRRSPMLYTVACLLVPVLGGYLYLNVRGHLLGTNASYDAYKILAVFYPCLLPAAGFWAAWGLRRTPGIRWLTAAAMIAVLAGNLRVAVHFARRVQIAPLTVSREMFQLQSLENRAEIRSVNLLVMDGWSRLWANALLLRLPQYFETHTYEGRLNTPLRGAWDLVGGFIAIQLPDGGSQRLSSHYSLVDARSPYLIRAYMGDGWYDPEHSPDSTARWIWTKGSHSTIRLRNPGRVSRQVEITLELRTLGTRTLEIWLDGKRLQAAPVGPKPERYAGPIVSVPPGDSLLELRSGDPVTAPVGDSRPLGFCIYEIALEVLPTDRTQTAATR